MLTLEPLPFMGTVSEIDPVTQNVANDLLSKGRTTCLVTRASLSCGRAVTLFIRQLEGHRQ